MFQHSQAIYFCLGLNFLYFPKLRANSAIGTAPRPWMGAMVRTFRLRRLMLSQSTRALGAGGAGGGSGVPGAGKGGGL